MKKEINRGAKNGNWRGGRFKSKQGYVFILDRSHPDCNPNGYVLEHRLVMSKHIGRPLSKKEVVHHKNHIRHDNRISNLQLVKNNAEHMKLHKGICHICGKPQRANGLCSSHWWSIYNRREKCKECGKNISRKTPDFYCVECRKKNRIKQICFICGNLSIAKNLCGRHYQLWVKRNRPLDKDGKPCKKTIETPVPLGYLAHKK